MHDLHLSVQSPSELKSALTLIDIRLPEMTGGRTTKASEKYVMANVLATIADSDHLQYPATVEHRDKPDFLITCNNRKIGVECVILVPQEWQEIRAIRDRAESSPPIVIPQFSKFRTPLNLKMKRDIAIGNGQSYPVMGNEIEVNWANGLAECIIGKTTKLQNGNYSKFPTNWLLIDDRWPSAIHFESDLYEAAELTLPLLPSSAVSRVFDIIFVKSYAWLVKFQAGKFSIMPIQNLWKAR